MKFIFTKHELKDKLPALKQFGWNITKAKVKKTVLNPRWREITKHGEETAMDLADENDILRVIFKKEDDIIKIVTLHIARRGKYGSTLR